MMDGRNAKARLHRQSRSRASAAPLGFCRESCLRCPAASSLPPPRGVKHWLGSEIHVFHLQASLAAGSLPAEAPQGEAPPAVPAWPNRGPRALGSCRLWGAAARPSRGTSRPTASPGTRCPSAACSSRILPSWKRWRGWMAATLRLLSHQSPATLPLPPRPISHPQSPRLPCPPSTPSPAPVPCVPCEPCRALRVPMLHPRPFPGPPLPAAPSTPCAPPRSPHVSRVARCPPGPPAAHDAPQVPIPHQLHGGPDGASRSPRQRRRLGPAPCPPCPRPWRRRVRGAGRALRALKESRHARGAACAPARGARCARGECVRATAPFPPCPAFPARSPSRPLCPAAGRGEFVRAEGRGAPLRLAVRPAQQGVHAVPLGGEGPAQVPEGGPAGEPVRPRLLQVSGHRPGDAAAAPRAWR